MNNISIIKCEQRHSEITADLIIKLLKDFNARNGGGFMVDRASIISTAHQLIGRPTFGCYVAFENEQAIGLITIAHSFAIYNGGDFGVITELYVADEKRSRGIGKLLLNKAYDFAKQHNWKKLEVGAPNKENWPRTIHFYKNNGFEEKGPKLRLNLE